MPISNQTNLIGVASTVMLDYIKTLSLLHELSLAKSRFVNIDEIPYFAFKKILTSSANDVYELMRLIDYVAMAVNPSNLSENNLEKIVPNIDFFVFASIYSESTNSLIKEVLENYKGVKRLLVGVTEFSTIKKEAFMSNGRPNYKSFRDKYEKLLSSSEVSSFLEDFRVLSSEVMIESIKSNFLSEIIDGDKELGIGDKKVLLLPNMNLLAWFDMSTKSTNLKYQNFLISHIVHLEEKDHIVKDKFAELRSLSNFIFISELSSKKNEDKKSLFLEEVSRGDFTSKIVNGKYDEVLKIVSSHAKNDKLTPSGIFAIDFIFQFKAQLGSIERKIINHIREILDDEVLSLPFKLLDIELFVERELLMLFNGKKIDNQGTDGMMLEDAIKASVNSVVQKAFEKVV